MDIHLMPLLHHANIVFNEQGTPVAADFDDVYFSNDGGLAETEYVFLQQNGLPERFYNHDRAAFHIMETGFGTGANFLVVWQHFKQFLLQQPDATCKRLYFSSFEKFPLFHSDLQRALLIHSNLGEYSEQLLAVYPPALPGCHRLVFEQGQVVLDLWFGDVNSLLPELPDTTQVDAFFLDGFAPSKNAQMWQPALFTRMAEFSHRQTTVATFTAAGIVKQGLTAAGFNIRKVKGFGRKRDMLTATFSQPLRTLPVAASNKKIIIAGGGIAALSAALSLCQRGFTVELLCKDSDVAQGASHNRQGAVYPNLHTELTIASQLHYQAFYFCRQFYNRQQQLANFAMDWCGLLHLATTPELQKRQQKMLQQATWPESLVQAVSAEQASAIAALPLQHDGIFFPQAGWLSPQHFCQATLAYLQQFATFRVRFNCQLHDFSKHADSWQLTTSDGTLSCQVMILANGDALADFPQTAYLPVNKVKGQVSHIQQPAMQPLKTVLCHKGYITPQWQGLHCIGATFEREATSAATTATADEQNVEQLTEQLSAPEWFEQTQVVSAKAAFRATVPDRLPLSGNVIADDNTLFVFGGLGARGILLAPLLAEIMACQLAAEPVPAGKTLLARISPLRFQI